LQRKENETEKLTKSCYKKIFKKKTKNKKKPDHNFWFFSQEIEVKNKLDELFFQISLKKIKLNSDKKKQMRRKKSKKFTFRIGFSKKTGHKEKKRRKFPSSNQEKTCFKNFPEK